MFRSPLRFPGGKQRLVKEIALRSPSSFREYREPFLGGGSVFLWFKQQTNISISEWWINDLFTPLAQFWQHLQNYPTTLTERVYQLKLEGTNFGGKQLRIRLISEYQTMSAFEQAAAFFVLNRITYSGLTFSGGYSEAGRFELSHIKALDSVWTTLSNVKITNQDYSVLLQEPGDDVFLFLDPPYDIPSNNLYGNKGTGHKLFDHIRFAQECKKSPHKWLITYNDNQDVRGLFEGWSKIQTIPAKYSINSKQKTATELVITNY